MDVTVHLIYMTTPEPERAGRTSKVGQY